MGNPIKGRQATVFIGESEGDPDNPATLDEALASAAEEAVTSGLVNSKRSVWFDIVHLEVEIGNQHVKTYKVGITEQGGGS